MKPNDCLQNPVCFHPGFYLLIYTLEKRT